MSGAVWAASRTTKYHKLLFVALVVLWAASFEHHQLLFRLKMTVKQREQIRQREQMLKLQQEQQQLKVASKR